MVRSSRAVGVSWDMGVAQGLRVGVWEGSEMVYCTTGGRATLTVLAQGYDFKLPNVTVGAKQKQVPAAELPQCIVRAEHSVGLPPIPRTIDPPSLSRLSIHRSQMARRDGNRVMVTSFTVAPSTL